MPIDTSILPQTPAPDVIIVRDSTQVPGLTGLAGRPNTRDSISLLGISDATRPDGTTTRHLAIKGLALYNFGDADWIVGPRRGDTRKYYATNPNFPGFAAVSGELLSLELIDDDGFVAAPIHPPILHWQAFTPDGAPSPTGHWLADPDGKGYGWHSFILEWQVGAILLADAAIGGPVIDIGMDIGMGGPWEGELAVSVHGAGQADDVLLPIRIQSRQAEVVW